VVTARALGDCVTRIADVGVAGIQRVLAKHRELREARVVIVVAGMDGALPSVIGGLVRAPVIAVPTSVGIRSFIRAVWRLCSLCSTVAPPV
jgi:NCAIR mutase (PurE)-related protein